jgi:hypothetical protein
LMLNLQKPPAMPCRRFFVLGMAPGLASRTWL